MRQYTEPQPMDPLLGAIEGDNDFHLGEYLEILRRRWRLLGLIAFLGVVVGFVHFLISPPLYRATTTVQIERQNALAVVTENLLQIDGGDSPNSAYYQTQYELLQSRGMAERVVKDLNLAENASFNPNRSEFLASSKKGAKANAAADSAALADLGTRLLSRLEVHPLHNTYLARISFVAEDPQLAATIANGVAEAYIDWGIETRSSTAGKATNFLASQIASLKEEINDKELQLQAYSKSSDIVASDPASNPVLQRLQALNSDYVAAVSERIDKEAHYHEVLNTPAENTADTLSNGLVSQLRKELLKREQEYATKSETYKPDWPAMVELRAQIAKARQHLKQVVSETADQARKTAQAAYQTALRREQSLADELKQVKGQALQQNSAAVEFNNLQVEISTRRALLDELSRKQSETEVASRLEGTRESNVRVVDRAVVPKAPFRPSMHRDLAFGLGLGFFLGLCGVFLLEYLDRSIKTSDQVERILGLPTLAVVPELGENASVGDAYYGSGTTPRTRRGPFSKRKLVEKRPQPSAVSIELVPQARPRLAASEAYRSLRTALLLSSAKELQTVAITSAHAAEGKSATACNLAVVMAQLGRQVLLIDGDLRKPRLHQIFRLSNREGLVNHLATGMDPARVVLRTAVDGLYVCPSGPVPPNPSELLSSQRMAELITLARSRFDFVIVDTPPALAVTDATLIGSLVDGTVLCLRAGRVVREDAVACVDRLLLAEVKILGAVLNGHRTSERHYGRYYYQSYSATVEKAKPTTGKARHDAGAA